MKEGVYFVFFSANFRKMFSKGLLGKKNVLIY